MAKDKPPVKKDASSNDQLVLGCLIGFRLCNALLLKTFFQPDEFFQSLEPAWWIAFGSDSGVWITWEWRQGLRSSLHPYLFAAAYLIADRLAWLQGVDADVRAYYLLAAPQILQAVLAALADFYTWKLARKVYDADETPGLATLALTVCSPWQWFCSTRTLSNCLETTLTSAACYYWPLEEIVHQGPSRAASRRLELALVLAATASVLRPTNVIIWMVLATCTFVYAGSRSKKWSTLLLTLVREATICGSAVLAVSFLADHQFYQEWTFPPLRFIHFNLVQSLAVFYGQNRPDYYFTEGIPLLLTTALPFAIIGLWQSLTTKSPNSRQALTTTLSLAVVTMLVALSLISHKEVRFIYPLLPILHVLAARPLSTFFSPFPRPSSALKKSLLTIMLIFNVSLAAYASLYHQRGVIDVVDFLRNEYSATHVQGFVTAQGNMTIGFLMPCHSTPWRSHLVYPGIQAWALTCEPPLGVPLDERGSYLDEADQFYASPHTWLQQNMVDLTDSSVTSTSSHEGSAGGPSTARAWPDYLVFFEQMEPTLIEYLEGSRYKFVWRGFNSHFHDDWRRNGDVLVWSIVPDEKARIR